MEINPTNFSIRGVVWNRSNKNVNYGQTGVVSFETPPEGVLQKDSSVIFLSDSGVCSTVKMGDLWFDVMDYYDGLESN
jgi:hypothetical protein